MNITNRFLSTTIILFVFLFPVTLYANKQQFTVIVDAGHGGKDPGARGKITQEKDINLSVALKLGKKIKQNYPDVKVIYTRETDIFIPLDQRAYIANKNHADLFISIHTNSTRSASTTGTETYVLGMHRMQENLEVAMKENSVITLEDDYKTRYEGFDPNSIDSYIMFNFMQDKYLDKSIEFASFVESNFKSLGRYSRGVRQAGFLVLRKPACPSVLIELGFISNRREERFLHSDSGQESLSDAIFKAFKSYKAEHDRKNTINRINNVNVKERNNDKRNNIKESNQFQPVPQQSEEVKDSLATNNDNKIVYKIQLFALNRKLSVTHSAFKGLKGTNYYKDGDYYKYTYGEASTFKEIEKIRKKIVNQFPKAYVVAFKGNKRITINEAMVLE